MDGMLLDAGRRSQISAGSAADAAAGGPNPRLLLLAAVVTVVLWASAFVVIRAVGTSYGPGELSLLRVAIGAAALTVPLLRRGFRIPPRNTWLGLLVLGLAWFAVYNVALNAAEHVLDAGTAAMLVNLAPLLVVLGAGVLLGEGFPRALLIGAPVSFAGVVLIGSTAAGVRSTVGVLLALLAALVYAGSTLLQKRLLAHIDGLTCTWAAAVIGAIGLLPYAPSMVHELAAAPLSATLGVAYLGIFPTAIAFSTWAFVLANTTAGRTSVTTYVVPALTVLMAWLLLAETPTPIALLGGVLCLLGVAISRFSRR